MLKVFSASGISLALALLSMLGGAGSLSSSHLPIEEFADFSLEELINIKVTSVSKREQDLNDAPAAIFVLTNEDIRHSGATSIPDALRLVPGMNVAQVNAHSWAITARGFNQIHANKLLVMIDGRTVYNPIFSGVFWDLQQPMLEDLDRIEVIRGPGATLWGANAVNGVVNVVTRDARETQGLALYTGGGDVNKVMSGARYGGQAGSNTYYRVFNSYRSTADFPLPNGQPAGDRWQASHTGFRLDHHPQEDIQMTWQADATVLELKDNEFDAYNYNTIGRWSRDFIDDSSIEFQAYYDQVYREEADVTVGTLDLSAQHRLRPGERNDFIWGLGYRFASAEVGGGEHGVAGTSIEAREGERDLHLYSMFVQNEFQVVPEDLILTVGTKIEHNSFTGYEVQPSIRGLFAATEHQSVWASVSRAARTPNLADGSDTFAIVIPPAPGSPATTKVVGNPDLKSEILWAYELGYRVQPTNRSALDLALFYNDYDRLQAIHFGEPQFQPGGPGPIAEVTRTNDLSGETYGGEAVFTAAPADNLRLSVAYSLLFARVRGPAGTSPGFFDESSPRNQVTLRSSLDLSDATTFDAQFRYVDTVQMAPSYLTADLGLTYRPGDQLEFSLVGQNLLGGGRHMERGWDFINPLAEVPRGFYATVRWQF